MEKEKGTAYSKKASVRGYGGRKENCILKESQYERVWRRKRELHTQRKPVREGMEEEKNTK